MQFKRLFVSSLLLISSIVLMAQENLLFRHFDTKGYSILTLYRDVNDVMWFGTSSGLVSFPQMMSRKPYVYNRGFAELNSSIDKICGDDDGKLWLKTINRDVVMYDPKNNGYEFNTANIFSTMNINLVKEYNVQMEENGNALVWKDDKFYALNMHKGGSKVFEKSFHGESIIGAVRTEKYIVSITTSAIYFMSQKDGSLHRRVVHAAKGQLWSYIYVMPNLDVWMRNGNVLYIYDYKLGEWKHEIVFHSSISGMDMDEDQNMWIGTTNDGIYIYDCQANCIRKLSHNVWDSNTLLSDKICSIRYDNTTRTMWIAYIKGGLSICSKKKCGQLNLIGELQPEHFPTDVLTLAIDNRGSVYAGLQEHGLFRKDASSAEWRNMVKDASVCALLCGKNDVLWAGLYSKGLLKKSADGTETTYFQGYSPYDIIEASEGAEQYVYTALLGEGVWRLNVKTGETKDLKIPGSYTMDIDMHDKRLYAATTAGFFVLEKDGEWKKLCEGKFRSFHIDSRGYKWILGNDGYEGLTVLGPQNNIVMTASNLKNASLKSIAVDDEDRVWITTSNELMMLQMERKTGEIAQYMFDVNSFNGYTYYNYRAILIDRDKNLWMGTSKGYQCISIRDLIHQLDKKPSSTALLIGSIAINDNVCLPGDSLNSGNKVLNKDVIFCKELNLKYNENNIVIECSQSGNEYFDTYIYYYRLRGSNDESWHPLQDNNIVLSNMSPGNYVLEVKNQSSDEQQLLSIRIAPPFWLSTWAYLLYMLVCVVAVCGMVRYYNNKKAYQLKLRELKLEQEQQALINEMKLRFFTNISHDLRTPLSLIIGPAEDLSKQMANTKHAESLRLIKRNAEHLLALVNQILDFRKLEFGREKLSLSYGDVVFVISDVCSTFRLKGEKENITLSFSSSVESIETLFDRDKTVKIMMNLLSNAFKFTSQGGSISISLNVSAGKIIVSVTDTGIGISDEDKKHIFERFYQSSTNMRSSIGSGIGLHLVREYVKLQGGEITVADNADGKGSVFCFSIPVREEGSDNDNENDNYSENSLKRKSSKNLKLKNSKQNEDEIAEHLADHVVPCILLVDDNADLLTYMKQSFEDKYRVIAAEDGKQALQLLQSEDVDIIVSDVMMPEIDGVELCRRVKGCIETSHIPVVLLTAKAMNSDELLGLEAGADDYITKPFNMDILQQRIHNIVERSKNNHQRFASEIDIEPSEITITSLDEQFIAQAISIVENHIADPEFNVEQLSLEMGVHRSQLYKKILHLTGKTPVVFIRLIRLKRGKQLLEKSGMYVSEVAYQVGFNSPRAFSKYFKDEFGMTPSECAK